MHTSILLNHGYNHGCAHPHCQSNITTCVRTPACCNQGRMLSDLYNSYQCTPYTHTCNSVTEIFLSILMNYNWNKSGFHNFFVMFLLNVFVQLSFGSKYYIIIKQMKRKEKVPCIERGTRQYDILLYTCVTSWRFEITHEMWPAGPVDLPFNSERSRWKRPKSSKRAAFEKGWSSYSYLTFIFTVSCNLYGGRWVIRIWTVLTYVIDHDDLF